MRIVILHLICSLTWAAGPERFGLDMPGHLDSLYDNGEELLIAARQITLTGPPALRAFVTSENDQMKQTTEVRPVSGTITLRAPARSLLSLTTASAQ